MENEDYSEKELLYYKTRFLQKISKSLQLTNALLIFFAFLYVCQLTIPYFLNDN